MSREERMLREVAAKIPHITFEELMGVSDELPSAVNRQIAHAADVSAVIDCWASMMHARVIAIAEEWKNVL